MPDIQEDLDIDIDPKDIRIDTYRSSGAGGQHINKTSSAIRITHFPTGIVVTCQNERSQFQNKDKAFEELKIKLFMMSNPGVAAKMFEALYNSDININMISTSEIRVTVLIDEKDAERAVNAVHEAFGLADE